MELYLLDLKKLQPTLNSTMLKLVEEAGELAREVRHENHDAILNELLDVAQTTATMVFVLKRKLNYTNIDFQRHLNKHFNKLIQKGYKPKGSCEISDGKISFPKLNLRCTIQSTCIQIMEESGELSQVMGKFSGASGETKKYTQSELINKLFEELFDVSQTCITMLYILQDEYNMDIKKAMNNHLNKMIEHGYI